MPPSVRLPPHRHCKNCKEPIPEDRWYCSQECEAAGRINEKGTSRKNLLFYGLAIAAVIALWLISVVL